MLHRNFPATSTRASHLLSPKGRIARIVGLLVAVTLTLAPALDVHARRKRPRRPAKDKKTFVEIMSMTAGATIYLDDKKLGVVPMEDPIEVTPNESHALRLQKRGFATFSTSFKLKAGESHEVEADLVPSGGILKVTCNIRRAQVMLDGKPIGRTPFDGDVPPGKHKLEVIAPGKTPAARLIDVHAGKEISLDIKLVDVPPPVIKKDTSVLGKWWFWTAIGAAVVGGATAAALASREVQVNPPQANLTLNIGSN